MAGGGLVLTAAAVYFLNKAGTDRHEFWVANAAIAKINADYAQNPFILEGDVKTAFDKWSQADATHKPVELKNFYDAYNASVASNEQLEGHLHILDTAQQAKMYASKLQAVASVASDAATREDALVAEIQKDMLAKHEKPENKVKDIDQKKVNDKFEELDGAAEPSEDAVVRRSASDEMLKCAITSDLHEALLCALALHRIADRAAIRAAQQTATASNYTNVVNGLQQGWTDCSLALQTIGTDDAAAYAAAATVLTSTSGGGSSKSSKSSSGNGN